MKLLYSYIFVIIFSLSYAQTYNYEEGVKAYDESNFEKALDYFNRDIKDNPESGFSYYYCALIHHYLDQNDLAISNINKSINNLTSKEKNWISPAYGIKGDIYKKIEQYDKALESYSKAIKLSPKKISAYTDRAQLYYQMKEYVKAEEDYKKAKLIDESEVMAWAGLGRNYLAQKRYTEAEKILTQLILMSPNYSGGKYYRAQLFYELKKYDEAIHDIFDAFVLNNDDNYYDMFLEYAEKNFPLALSKVATKIINYPQSSVWYNLRAQLFYNSTKFTDAIADYTKLIELSDINSKSKWLLYRADNYVNIGYYDKAIKDHGEAIQTDSSNSYIYGNRGDTKRLMGDYLGALNDFNKAILLNPEGNWNYYRRGWIKDEFLHDTNGGLEDYNYAIALNPKYHYTYLHRGRLYEKKLADTIKSKEDYLNILKFDTTVNSRGNCRQYALFHLNRIEDAIKWQDNILKQYPNSGNYYDATCLYSLMNKPKEAIEHLKLAFEMGYRGFQHVTLDDDLDNIRNLSEFKNLFQEWKKKFEISQKIFSEEIPQNKDTTKSTVTIPMKTRGQGTYEVPCKINELSLNMIFDTGASEISISRTEVQFMLKNGYLNSNDIIGTNSYMDANGNIENGTTIIFRKLDFGGLILKNVTASVVHNNKAPLLFGQSALGKYGKILIDNDKKLITITSKSTQ